MCLFFSPFKISSFAMSLFDIAFQNPSLPWIKSGLASPASLKPYLAFIQFTFPQKLFLPLFMGLGDLQRKYQISFEFDPKPTPLTSP